MGIFAMGARSAPPARSRARAELSEDLRAALPPGFEAVGEALVSGSGAVDSCAVAGRELALDGVSLDEALADLGEVARLVLGAEPGFADTRALALGWSEATLGYLHRLGCEDPATGLASLAHLQSRLPELYRGQLRGRPGATGDHALVVVEGSRSEPPAGRAPYDALTDDLWVARAAESVRTVFAAGETVARLGPHRVVVLVRRDDRLGRRVGLVRDLLGGLRGGVRVWIEGLPDTESAASATLAELARR